VFLLNSCLELDIAAQWALFLPKLQSYFAEFLKEGSLALLGILYLPTCVGFGYGCFWVKALRAFLGSMTLTTLIPLNLVFTSQLRLFSLIVNTSKI
jgi:hypothetical protein